MAKQTDVIIIGAGLAGLVAASKLAARGRKTILIDQEAENSLGGQAFWSLGGLFMVNTPEQRRMGIKDSYLLAYDDWMGSAGFDREEDHWPQKWAKAYLEYAASNMRGDLHALGLRWFPVVGWAERGGSLASGHGNTVPRFHLPWGVGPGIIEPYVRLAYEARDKGLLAFKFRHQVSELILTNGKVTGVRGEVLEPQTIERGQKSNRKFIGDFEFNADATIVTSGGIGGNFDLVRKNWPIDRLGQPPKNMVAGVPHYVDGRMLEISKKVGANSINNDRMWHYTEGLKNWDPIWPNHGIRILPGPSSMWFDAVGNRLPAPCMPGFDTLKTLKHILSTGYEYSWFILTQKIIEKEFALSGSEQNPDFASKKWIEVLKSRLAKGATAPVEAFKKHGEDFIVENDFGTLIQRMNALTGSTLLNADKVRSQIKARDRQLTNEFCKDAQIMAIRQAQNYRGDKLIRTAKPHAILDPKSGPLIAVRLNILTRKSLGGLHTNLESQALKADGTLLDGLYAAGEVAGFGGGGYHGYNALEGTFLGGCIFSGMKAGENA